MKKRIYRRKFGKGGKHEGLIGLPEEEPTSGSLRDLADAMKRWPSAEERVTDALELREGYAKKVLESLGYPTDYFGPYDLPGYAPGSRGTLTALLKDRKLEPEWHAARVLERIEGARSAIKRGDLHWAMNSAMLVEEAYWHTYLSFIEEPVRIGLDVKRKSPGATAQDKARWHRRAEEMFRSGEAKSARDIGERIASDEGFSGELIRKEITSTIKRLKTDTV